jgi:hypothetical protein
VKGRLSLERVPIYSCEFDPCTCTQVQKQCGTRLKLVRCPDRTETRQVTRKRQVVEQCPVVTNVRKTITEKKMVPVRKRVSTQVVEKIPVMSNRDAYGAYVDASALCGNAADAAKKGAAVVHGGPGCLTPGCATYDAAGPGRVFVEGAHVCREVTHQVKRRVPVTEIRRIPYTVSKCVPYETVRKVPKKVTRMVPVTVKKCVPITTCRIVREEKTKLVPTEVKCMEYKVVTKCVPQRVTRQVPCSVKVRVPCAVTEMLPPGAACHGPACHGRGQACLQGCDSGRGCREACAYGCEGACKTPCGPRCKCSPCSTCEPCRTSVSDGLRCVLNDPCRSRPVRDFFSRLCEGRLACDPCSTCTPCQDACAAPCK